MILEQILAQGTAVPVDVELPYGTLISVEGLSHRLAFSTSC
jgi:hypothetical protein